MSALDGVTVLFVPGLRDHVEDHWQTHAAKSLPRSVTVGPLRVDGLSRSARVAALDAAIRAIEGDLILAAHSAGCLMVAHWAIQPTRKVRGALLATPADVEQPLPEGYPTLDVLSTNGWMPIPRAPLPFPTLVVASRNDPLGDFGRVATMAQNWRARLYDGGEVGHLNSAAGFGPWDNALPLLTELAAETTV